MQAKRMKSGLIAGFGVALLLMVFILFIGMTSLYTIQQGVKSIVNNHNKKTELLHQMRVAARERTISLHRMLLTRDPFERDDEFMRFNRLALRFVLARQEFLSMTLTPAEEEALEEQSRLTQEAVTLQNKVVDLSITEEFAAANALLYQETIPAQENVFEVLSRLLLMQRQATERAVDASEKTYRRAFVLMALFGIVAILTGVGVAFWVIRRTVNAEARLFRDKERIQVTLDSIGEGIISTDAQGTVEYINSVTEQLTGWSNTEAKGKTVTEVFNVVDEYGAGPDTDPVRSAIENCTIDCSQTPMMLETEGGPSYAVEYTSAPIRGVNKDVVGAVLVFRNITELRNMAHQMTYQATHDSLTGLINRREFEQRLEEAISSTHVGDNQHVLVYMDLDQFKVVNDTCGHVAGDQLLKQLSAILNDTIRKSDMLARLGGDEFAVLFYECDVDRAVRKVDEIKAAICEFRFVWDNKSFDVGASVGIVEVSRASGGLNAVLSAADAACFVAKEKGRNRYHIYKQEDDALTKRRGEMQWLPRIKKALECDKFLLYYQDIVSVQQPERVPNREILLRLQQENGEIVPPMAFLPSAERYDQMTAIDSWVVNRAFELIAHINANTSHPGIVWNINLSGQTLSNEHMYQYIYEKGRYWGVDPQCVCFEVTETAAVANLSGATQLMSKLKQKGYCFALDDFGSGLSSFNYLKHLPVDYLKIDGGFIKNLIDNPIDFAMVSSINEIGHILQLQTIAEFVEKEDTLELLKKLGVDLAQGYSLHRPQPLAELLEAASDPPGNDRPCGLVTPV